jgi:hypothetical protein
VSSDPPSTELLEWFRVDRSRGTWRLLGTGTILVFVGATLVACGIFTHSTSATLRFLTLVGAAFLVFGLVTAFGGMTILLAQDEYLAVRVDAVLVRRTRGEVVLAWADLKGIRCDEANDALVFETTSDAAYVLKERYSGVTPKTLAPHLEELRRKAAVAPLDRAQVARIALGLPHRTPS